MLEIIYYVATSLDGFIATADGGVDWLTPFQRAGEDYGYADFYASIDALVMGRLTYNQVFGFGAWPYGQKPCMVMTSRPVSVLAAGAAATSASPQGVVEQLMAAGVRRLWLVGGSTLLQSFRAGGLISEYYITIMPILLGAGVPLFPASDRQEPLQLAACQQFSNGVLQARWQTMGASTGGVSAP
jgi:dihydrofolate reductase